jgi:hypothetical protein
VKVVADGRLAAGEDLRHLVRGQPLDLAQQEGHPLLVGEAGGQLAEDGRDLALLQPRQVAVDARVGRVEQVHPYRLGAPLAALPRAQVVDRQVARDPVDPGVRAPLQVELLAVLPDPEEGDLHHVARLLGVAQDALAELHQLLGLAADQLAESLFVAVAEPQQELAVGAFGPGVRRAGGGAA